MRIKNVHYYYYYYYYYENQNTVIVTVGQLEDLPQADFGRVPERFLLSVRTKATAEQGD